MKTGKRGDPIYSNMYMAIQVENSKTLLDLQEKSAANANKLMQNAKPGIMKSTTVKRLEIAGKPALLQEMNYDVSKIAEEGMNRAALDQMLGLGGQMLIYYVAADEHTVLAGVGVSQERMAAALDVLKQPKKSLGEDTDVAVTAAMLPAESQWVAYVSPRGYIQLGQRAMAATLKGTDMEGYSMPRVRQEPADRLRSRPRHWSCTARSPCPPSWSRPSATISRPRRIVPCSRTRRRCRDERVAVRRACLAVRRAADRAGLRRRLSSREGAQAAAIDLDGQTLVNFGSNDYLALAADPRLAAAAIATIQSEGVGSGASPLVTGRSRAHERLEQRLAEFEGTEAALVFPSGFAANLAAVAALAGPGDVVFSDAKNHASLWDGCRLSRADVRAYPHADWRQLDAALGRAAGYRRRLIVTDGLFSMDGDLAPLVELAGVARRHEAMLLVDEAHATGVFCAGGRGVAEHLGVEASVRRGSARSARHWAAPADSSAAAGS